MLQAQLGALSACLASIYLGTHNLQSRKWHNYGNFGVGIHPNGNIPSQKSISKTSEVNNTQVLGVPKMYTIRKSSSSWLYKQKQFISE